MPEDKILIFDGNSREMLRALLDDMEGMKPQLSLNELGSQDKLFMLVACCADMIASAIRVASKDRADAMHGLDSLVDDIRKKLERHYDERKRPN